MGQAISKLTIRGYKSIRNLENFELRNINILIGPNGAGKSNFIEFFGFLRDISKGRSQHFVAYQGGADRILYLGSKVTKELVGSIISTERSSWEFKLFPSRVDKLLFYEEEITGRPKSISNKKARKFEHGSLESTLFSKGYADDEEREDVEEIRSRIQAVIENWVVYHFHDTSDFAGVKKPCSKRDYEYLRSDASNLAAFLLRLKKKHQREYSFIREVIQLAAPFFDDFWLREEDDQDDILLEWRQKGPDYPFHPSQISDGTLRFICLATALLQPDPPSTILLDEPELGLHPYALTLLAGLIQKASFRTQVIVSTQSAGLIDNFEPEDIVIVERENGESKFRRLNKADLNVWLEDYSLGDLWQRNILGGRPARE